MVRPVGKLIVAVRKIDELTVDLVLAAPDAVLPEKLVYVAMMSKAWAGEHGYSQVWLRSNVKRNQAHSFYQRHGYELVKTSYTFRKPLATTAVQVKAV